MPGDANLDLDNIKNKMLELVTKVERSTKYPVQIPFSLINNEINSLLIFKEKIINNHNSLESTSIEIEEQKKKFAYYEEKVIAIILSIQNKIKSFLEKSIIEQFDVEVEELIKDFAQLDFDRVPLYLKFPYLILLNLNRCQF